MNVIIIGAGDVGYQIAKQISAEEHNVTIIDQNLKKILNINQKLDVMTIHGEGSHPNTLNQAFVQNCHVFIATTNSDEVNIIACFIAKKYSVPLTIARIRNDFFKTDNNQKNPLKKQELGIDVLINPEEVATFKILKLINSPASFEVVDFEEKKISIKGFQITKGLNLINTPLKDLTNIYPDLIKIFILTIIRKNQWITPSGSDILLPEDKIYVIGKTEDFKFISPYFHESYQEIKKVSIVGISNITYRLCRFFESQGIQTKVIESNKDRCMPFLEKFDKIDIINCLATDLEALKDEGLVNVDAFIAVSEDEENNILSAMLAKNQNVRKTIARIQNNNYLPFTSMMGIDAAINLKISTVGEILKYVRRGNILSVDTLIEKNSEVSFYKITKKFAHLNVPIKKLKLPEGILIAAIIRGKERIIARGNDFFQINDTAIVFSHLEFSHALEKIFN